VTAEWHWPFGKSKEISHQMKKFMSIMLALGLVIGTASITLAQDTKDDTKKADKKKKGSKKKGDAKDGAAKKGGKKGKDAPKDDKK
jgi:hypothetical protein